MTLLHDGIGNCNAFITDIRSEGTVGRVRDEHPDLIFSLVTEGASGVFIMRAAFTAHLP
jgi:hypothetical protein